MNWMLLMVLEREAMVINCSLFVLSVGFSTGLLNRLLLKSVGKKVFVNALYSHILSYYTGVFVERWSITGILPFCLGRIM